MSGAARPRLAAGARLGPYEVVELLGAGGMGEVYRARDPRLARDVAVKVLPPDLSLDPTRLSRFEREARTAGALNHPNLVAVFDTGRDDGIAYVVFELLDGQTLRQRLDGAPLAPAKAVELAVQVAHGLAAAHERGIVHRDLKPENVFVTRDGHVKILDFGLAKLRRALDDHAAASDVATPSEITERGAVVGTPGYMSPEQVKGQPVDPRSDVFSFGSVLYEMVAAKRPFEAGTTAETMTAILKDDPPHLPAATPPALERIVKRCLEKRPDERFQTAREVAYALEALAGPGALRSRSLSGTAVRRLAARPRLTAFALAVAVGAILAAALWHSRKAPPLTDRAPIRSLAVLPLSNLTGDPAQEYFSDGMTEALITNLASWPALRVVSRQSVMRYKGSSRSLPEIARELGVEGVVEGSVVRSGGRVRITAQLIHAPTDRHLWARSYERGLEDILALQGELSRAIAEEVRITVGTDEKRRLTPPRTVKPEAYDAYLLGRYHWNQRTQESLEKALSYFQTAVARDPNFALAHAGVALASILRVTYGHVPPGRGLAEPKAAALRALELDPGLGEARAALGVVLGQERDWEGAEAEFRRALETDPNSVVGHLWYGGYLRRRGRFEESLAHRQRALALDPLNVAVNRDVAADLAATGRDEAALAQWNRVLELEPDQPQSHFDLALFHFEHGHPEAGLKHLDRVRALEPDDPEILADLAIVSVASGNEHEARRLLARVKAASSRRYVSPVQPAMIHAALGERDRAFALLEEAYAAKDPALTSIHFAEVEGMPFPRERFAALRSDPRFGDLVRRMGSRAQSK